MSRVAIPKFGSSIAPVSLAEYRSSISQVSRLVLEYRTRSAGHSVMRAIFERYFGIVTRDTLTILEPNLTLHAVLGPCILHDGLEQV